MNESAKKRYKDIKFPFTCPISNKVFKDGKTLSFHLSRNLKIDHSEYYDRYINHRDISCFFCGGKGLFISVSKGYRNLCEDPECVKKSFRSHTIEGFMYRNQCAREEAEKLFESENQRQLNERIKSHDKLRKEDTNWDKKRSRNCKEFWIEKGYSEDESIEKTKEVMKEIHQKTFQKFKENPEKYASKYDTKIEYYLSKGYSPEEGKKLLSERQKTFSLEKCIEKYGEEIGTEIFIQRQEKWQKSLKENGNMKFGYSEISQILFREILNYYHIDKIKDVFYWTKNNEFYIKSDKSIYLYDFTDLSKNKMIEYNGDQYHANPNIYNSDDYPHPYHKKVGYSAKDIWEKDKRKIDLAISKGFEVLTIWDSEYRKDKEGTLKKCLDFLK